MAGNKTVKVGGGLAFFDDSLAGFAGLIEEKVDYVIFDHLAEVTMSFLARDKVGHPSGYYPGFLEDIRPYLVQLLQRQIKIVTNWGGLNPRGAAVALGALAAELGCTPSIATVDGDDLTEITPRLRSGEVRDMFGGDVIPQDAPISSINAYLGAFPIARALRKGADIVITGRVVDSALTLGPLIHEFGWSETDYDFLASGTLAGHLLECSTQVTGGTFTDWHLVPGWDAIGNPIGECCCDGSFTLTKPKGSGGLVSVGTVMEQMIYEVGDPQAYIVPDVVCDFSEVRVTQIGEDKVRLQGAKGYPPTPYYKVCATYDQGWRGQVYQPIIGRDAARKAERQAQALFDRADRILRSRGFAPLKARYHEVLGTEMSYGRRSRQRASREVIAMMTADHDEKYGVEVFLREQISAISAMAPGTLTNLGTNRITGATPLTKVFLFLVPKSDVRACVSYQNEEEIIRAAEGASFSLTEAVRQELPAVPAVAGRLVEVALEALAWGRSGDKGNLFNVGVFARREVFMPYIAAALSEEAVGRWFDHFLEDPHKPRVDRYYLPGTNGLNFVVHDSLAGGGSVNYRFDKVGKGMAQLLLEFPIPLPELMAEQAKRLYDKSISF